MSIAGTLGSYTLRQTLYEGSGGSTYRAVRNADQRPVILKVLDPGKCRAQDAERLRNEYELEQLLDGSAVVRPIALETLEGMPVLVTEDFAAEPLDRLRVPVSLDRFLALAVRIAAAVEQLHSRGVVHRDLRPENIVVSAAGDVRIANFGVASRLPREQMALRSMARLTEESLPYISPEQTGRVNLPVDRRSDLYSIGVTLYWLLTGRLPFEAEDPLGWVHCHVARMPAPPAEILPQVPDVVSSIVLKLLAKAPEARYQSAAGLRHDLEQCRASCEQGRRVPSFVLGTRDWSDRLLIPQKLYGRDADAAALADAFTRVAATGTPELVLLSGQAGIGKSSLVQGLRKGLAMREGFFASGKFERHKREIPYLTIVEACREIVLDVLAESEEALRRWKHLLERSVVPNGQVLMGMLPELRLLLGPQPPVEELPPVEAENRTQFSLRRFLGVFAQPRRPLVIFLDDLQWADPASLRLLEHVIGHPETRHLLVIGAYRDDEVVSSRALVDMVARLRSAGVQLNELVLRPLSQPDTGRLVADTVRCRPEDAMDLARQVHAKTGGNPFFAIQFLKELEHKGLIALSPKDGAWRWDVARIAAEGCTDNVVDMMIGRLKFLPQPTQQALQLCACLGNSFDCDTASTIVSGGRDPVEDLLRPVLEEDLLIRVENGYRFPHDRVHEAAYALIPESERAAVHLSVGRSLLRHTAAEKIEENVFEIVRQLSRGTALIASQEERDELARLNRLAGDRAKAAGAYISAAQYFSNGVVLLGADAWDREHELIFALELGRGECEYVAGSRDEAERTLSVLVDRSSTRVEVAAVASVQIRLFMTQGQPDKAVDAGIQLLRRFGIELSAHPPREQVLREWEHYWQSLGDRRIEQLVDLPTMTDRAWEWATEVLLQLVGPAVVTDPYLLPLIPIHVAQIGLRHGHCDAACFAYGVMGTLARVLEGDCAKASQFAQLATDLMDRSEGLVRHRPDAYQTLADCIRWIKPLRALADLRKRQFELAERGGDLNTAGYAVTFGLSDQLFVGDSLDDVMQGTVKGLEFLRRAGFGLAVDIVTSQQRLVLSLQGKTETLGSFGGADFDERAFEAHLATAGPAWAVAQCWHYTRKLQAACLAGDYVASLQAASKASETLWTSVTFLERVELTFYRALALAAMHDSAAPDVRAKHREKLLRHEGNLAAWARACPDNFEDRHALVAAEVARIDGAAARAADLYEQAIATAKRNRFVHSEALAYELASKFYRGRRFALIADTYLREARDRYLRWGAHGKVLQIDRLHPWLVRAAQPVESSASSPSPPTQLDLLSVLRATQTISREIDQNELVRTLLEVVLKESGARTARLVLVRGEDLRLEAEASADGRDGEGAQTRLLGSVPVSSTSPLPVSILNYVRRTKERVLLDDARADAGSFATDPYLARESARSILCQPVLRQDQVIAILVLENDLVPGVFTSSRLTALELLATQAAISMENALLLRREHSARLEAEDSVRARDEFLAVASHELGTPVTSLSLTVQGLRVGKGASSPENIARATDLLERQVGRLKSLIDDMLSVGRILVGSLEINPAPMDLAALVRDEVERTSPALARAQCEVTLRADRAVHGTWDCKKVSQVVTNLLANAMKFGAGKPIEICVDEVGGTARLTVVDHGIGIDSRALPHIFEKFERAVAARSYGGLGLGLFIVRNIVEAMGGSVRAESVPNVETRFTVELPAGGRA